MDIPDRIHFFSYVTGVSLELPVGFTGSENDGGATYAMLDDDDDDGSGQWAARAAVIVTMVDGGPPNGASLLVESLASTAAEVLDRSQEHIDDELVMAAQLHFPEGLPSAPQVDEPGVGPLLARDLFVLFAAVPFGGRVATITAAAPYSEAGHYRQVFDEALRSCRFIASWEAAS